MDNDVLLTKLDSLAKCIARIESQHIASKEELEQNFDKQDIIVLNLQRAVQICVDVGNHILLDYPTAMPATMAETFVRMNENGLISKANAENLSHAVGFRNLAVHQYDTLDCGVVFAIITKHLDDFREFAAAMGKLIK